MAEIDKNNFTPSQRTACLCIQRLLQQKDDVGMDGGEGGPVIRGIVVFASRMNVSKVRSLLKKCLSQIVVLFCKSTAPLCSHSFSLLQHLPLPSALVFAALYASFAQTWLLLSEDVLRQVTGAALSLLQ